ncbi:MAG: hypothetical protein Phog2KO_15280 [Phototrophicaceae bacterium]
MQFLRRLLYVPVIVLLGGALLLIFNVISLDINLPLSVEAIAGIAGVALAGLLVMDARTTVAQWEHPEPEDPPISTKVIYPKTIEETVDAFQEAEEFASKVNGRVQISIDIEEDTE